MSWQPCPDPVPGDAPSVDAVDTVVVPRVRDLGCFEVRRALPAPKCGMVGPFIFCDQMGPAEFLLNEGIDIRPHPHINLSTVTYLFDGEITHRDSLGTEQVIRPGAVNWMTAGRGITHSERSSAQTRQQTDARLFGVQTWVAMPERHEESEPSFVHIPQNDLPLIEDHGLRVRLVAGTAWGETAPTETLCDTLHADVRLAPGRILPVDADHEERALYIVAGEVIIGQTHFSAGRLVVLRPDCPVSIRGSGSKPSRFLLLGGETMDGPRYIWWNFVSSRSDRIEQARADWRTGRFDTVPGDAEEYIELPDAIGKPRRIQPR